MNISELNFENAHLFLEDFEIQQSPIVEKPYTSEQCQDCHGILRSIYPKKKFLPKKALCD